MIKNKQELLANSPKKEIKEARKKILEILEAGIESALPERAVFENVKLTNNNLIVCNKSFDLDKFKNIYIIGYGKASGSMAKALENILEDRITDGFVVIKEGQKVETRKIKILYASHPILSFSSIEAAKKIISICQKASNNDLIISLTSGGGSSLFELPKDEISLEDLQNLNDLLLKSGANINQINSIRKTLSNIKGGKLANYTKNSTVINLIVSDVVGNELESIASGPLCLSKYKIKPKEILKKYGLWEKVAPNIKSLFLKQEKINKDFFNNIHNFIILDNMVALNAAKTKAESLGLNTLILSSIITGESKEVARTLAEIGKEIEISRNPLAKPACIISGGETVVTIKSKGKGGRNQEFVLSFLIEIDCKNFIVAAIDTDGIDGDTDAAGAIADFSTKERAKKMKIAMQNFLDNNDSYHFFKMMNDLIITHQTGTNINDFRIFIIF